MTIICIGPKKSGKTHLLTCLRDPEAINFTSHSVPSVGTNIFVVKNPNLDNVKVEGTKSRGKQKPLVEIREVGGTMAPLWNRYYENVEKLIYVVDTSNLCEVSGAGVLLYGVLAEPRMAKVKVLLVLSKMDLAYRQMRNECCLMLQLNKLKKQIKQPITLVEASAVTNVGINEIIEWIFK